MDTSKNTGLLFLLFSLCISWGAAAQFLLKPSRVFDGNQIHDNWVVLVEASEIAYAGPLSGLKVSEKHRNNLPGRQDLVARPDRRTFTPAVTPV